MSNVNSALVNFNLPEFRLPLIFVLLKLVTFSAFLVFNLYLPKTKTYNYIVMIALLNFVNGNCFECQHDRINLFFINYKI